MSLGATAVRHRFVATNGIRLHVAEAGPEGGALMLFLHGFPEFWYAWHRQLAYFARRGFRVWAPDLRGYARSDKPRPVDAYAMPELVSDVAGLVDAAGARGRAVVVGHDWGGVVAWSLATSHPAHMRRLVVLDAPHPAVMRRALRHDPVQMLRSWYALALQVPVVPEGLLSLGRGALAARVLQAGARGALDEADLALYREAWSEPGAWTGMINWYRAAARGPRPGAMGRRRRPRVRVPTLVLWGALDPAVGKELVGPCLELCDHAESLVLEDVGHFAQHEAAARVNEAIARFVGARGGAGGRRPRRPPSARPAPPVPRRRAPAARQ